MELTIHGVERLQERTALFLSELRTVFAKDAFVSLGFDDKGTEYALFYDDQKNKYRIAVISADKALISIWKIYYFTIPEHIKARITDARKNVARTRFLTRVRDMNKPKKRSNDDRMFVWLEITHRHTDIHHELVHCLSQAGWDTLKRTEVLRIYAPEIARVIRSLAAKDGRLPLDTAVYGLRFLTVNDKRLVRYCFKFREVMAALEYDDGYAFSGTLTVTASNERHVVHLGTIPPEKTQSEQAVVNHYWGTLRKVVVALEQNSCLLQQHRVRYEIEVVEPASNILVRSFYRPHNGFVDRIKRQANRDAAEAHANAPTE